MLRSRIAVYSGSALAAANDDLFKSLEFIANLGFKEVNFSHLNAPRFESLSTDERRSILSDYPHDLGLDVVSASYDISAGRVRSIPQRMRPFCDAIELCADCGIPILIVHGGERIVEDEDRNRAAWMRLVEDMKRSGAYGADRGVRIAMEPGGGVWMVHGWRLLNRLRDEVGERFSVNLDPANILMSGEDPVEAVRVLKDAVIHVHLKDVRLLKQPVHVSRFVSRMDARASSMNFAEWRTALLADCTDGKNFWSESTVGEGDVDFEALLVALDDVGFDGWMAIEREGKQTAADRKRDILKARDRIGTMIDEANLVKAAESK